MHIESKVAKTRRQARAAEKRAKRLERQRLKRAGARQAAAAKLGDPRLD